MASSTGVAPPTLPNAPAVGRGDVQQVKVMSSGHNATEPVAINPLLLASACVGSSDALKFLFAREDAQEPPMMIPTPVFLVKLEGYTPGSSTGRTQTVLPASDDVEAGVVQPAAALPAGATDTIEAGVGQAAALLVSDGPALKLAVSGVGEDGADQPARPAAARLLKGVAADGDTALHAVASQGDGEKFLMCVSIIDGRDHDLLLVENNNGDTPLHCAARAGNSQMVSRLIELSASGNRLEELLRKENGLKETALHEAVRIGNQGMVARLLTADPGLANYPKQGTSPVYLAVFQEKYSIAKTLHSMSNGNLSYYGLHGQNVLHDATLQDMGITKDIVNWNDSLTTKRDRDGSTPLHFASSLRHSNGFEQLFEANPAPLYQADNNGLFPIHVAAAVGAKNTIRIILGKFLSSAGLRTAHGRTFLHVAVEKYRFDIVLFVCKTPSLNWILNMRDNEGNTALHLAVQANNLQIFCSLYGNKEVDISLANKNKQTPLDISRSLIRRGMYFYWSTDNRIYMALKSAGAKHNSLRQDQIEEKYSKQFKPEDKIKAAENIKDTSQMLGIGTVLIATVAFGATFAVPRGFIADDHTSRGTPTLAGRYTFDAFMVANALAFVCSSIATVGLMFSGSPMVNLRRRQINLGASLFFMSSSVTSLSAAFALGVYMVLAPVAHGTAVVVCALSPLVVLYRNLEILAKVVVLTKAIHLRMGIFRAFNWFKNMIIFRMFVELWPFIIIFGWAAIAQKLRKH